MSITVDRTSQRYASSAQPEADILVLHTTEGMSWPGYGGGGSAPHVTIRPIPGKGIEVREHIPFTQYARALVNLPGGPQTNRRGVLQVELIGTCDPKHRGSSAWYFWPEADAVVIKALADYFRPILAAYKIPHRAPTFVAYPASYGTRASQRLSAEEWNSYNGIVGHQHVPENSHGDPGAFPIAAFIKALGATPSTAKPAAPAPSKPRPRVPAFPGVTRPSSRVNGATRAFQARLRARGWEIGVDGKHGPQTTRVLKAFQKQKGLKVDGIGGPQTWVALWTLPTK